MQEENGKNLLNKYVKKIPAKKKESSHVGGALTKKDDPLHEYRKINKLGLDTASDY